MTTPPTAQRCQREGCGHHEAAHVTISGTEHRAACVAPMCACLAFVSPQEEQAPRPGFSETDGLWVRGCRGHFHVTCEMDDLAVPGDPFKTEEAALAYLATRRAATLGDTPTPQAPTPRCTFCNSNKHQREDCTMREVTWSDAIAGVGGLEKAQELAVKLGHSLPIEAFAAPLDSGARAPTQFAPSDDDRTRLQIKAVQVKALIAKKLPHDEEVAALVAILSDSPLPATTPLGGPASELSELPVMRPLEEWERKAIQRNLLSPNLSAVRVIQRYELLLATQAASLAAEQAKNERMIDEAIESLAEMQKLRASLAALRCAATIPHDFFTHKANWRDAIDKLMCATQDADEKAYWRHELAAFDHAYEELSALRRALTETQP